MRNRTKPSDFEIAAAIAAKITSGTEQQASQWLASKDFVDDWQKISEQCANNRQARRLLVFVKSLRETRRDKLSMLLQNINREISYIQKMPVSNVISTVDSMALTLNTSMREQLVGSTIKKIIELAMRLVKLTKMKKIEDPITFKVPRQVEWDINPVSKNLKSKY